jgi:mRNA interferase MazF
LGRGAPGNVAVSARLSRLPKDSVANVSQIIALDREVLTERVGRLPWVKIELILAGSDIVLGREPSRSLSVDRNIPN